MTDVTQLHLSTTDVQSRRIDWEEAEDGDGFDYWETFTYEDPERDGDGVLLLASRSSTTHIIINGRPFELDDHELYLQDFGVYNEETGEDEMPDGGYSGEDFDRYRDVEPYQWGSEGPMMNYWYPIEEEDQRYSRSFRPEDAAAAIAHLPLCVVLVGDEYGLALTGGGMDLSWEIAEAYIALGKLPPAFVVTSLPHMAGMSQERIDRVLPAARRTFESIAERATWRLEKLNREYGQAAQ